MTRYLANTYAFIEAFTGNPRYARILRSGQVVTTAANVLELHYSLLRREVPTEEAERLSRATLRLVVDVPSEVALAAARTRFDINERHRADGSRQRVSNVDAWGYEAARNLGLSFLTGDPVFKGLPGVAFVR